MFHIVLFWYFCLICFLFVVTLDFFEKDREREGEREEKRREKERRRRTIAQEQEHKILKLHEQGGGENLRGFEEGENMI